ncbi:MAG: M20/M25/M40 family metallo-hydrolase [Bryobacterales bacterium]
MTLAEKNLNLANERIARLRADVDFLASPELEGRGTPSRGLDIAALYLETRLRALGVRPVSGSSMRQIYRLGDYRPDAATVEVSVGGRTLAADDYVFWNISRDPAGSPFCYPLVGVGQGVVAPGLNDLDGIALDGGAAVAIKGAPWELDPDKVFGPDRALGKIVAATVRGARMIVYLSDELDSGADEESRFFRQMRDATVSFLREPGVGHASALSPIVIVRRSAFEAALGRSFDASSKGPLDAMLEVRVDAPVRQGEASNVVGVLPGNDPELRNEYILLSAHYDHLGLHETPEGHKMWPGADDNASGVAGVLEVVRELAESSRRRSVLVFFGSGEERAILGSAFYNAHPLVPIRSLGVQLNLDMIGRSDGTIEGVADGSPDLFAAAAECAEARGIKLIPDRQPDWRLVYLTDTYHFARADRPFLFYFTGFHDDYHQPSDTPDKIRYPEMARIVESAADLARRYAEGEPLPKFTRPDWFVTPPE